MVLLGLCMGFGFSGYLLPWNTLAYFATKVGTAIAAVDAVRRHGILRAPARRQGGRRRDADALLRPARRDPARDLHARAGRAPDARPDAGHARAAQLGRALPESQKKYMPFFPNFVLRDLLLWLIVLNVLAILAVHVPVGAGPQGRSRRRGAGGHQARVVLPLHVPGAEVLPRQDPRSHRRRHRGRPAVRLRRAALGCWCRSGTRACPRARATARSPASGSSSSSR